MGAPGYEVPYASNYDYENQFFGGSGGEEVFAGVSLPGVLIPPIGAYEAFQDARQGKFQLPGGFGALTPPIGGRRGGDGRGDDSFPWTTFAWASLAVVGAGVIVYAATRGRTS